MRNNFGGEFWEEKIRAHGPVGVIIGTGATKKTMDRNTAKIMDVMESTLLQRVAPGATLLDLGVGPAARFAIALARKGYRLIGLDGAPTTLKLAGEAARAAGQDVELIEADFSDFKSPRPVDAIFSVESFYHLPAHLHLDAFRCVHAALKPGGHAFIQFSLLNEYTVPFLTWNLIYRVIYKLASPVLERLGRRSFVVTVSRTSEAEAEDIFRRAGFTTLWHEGDFYLLEKSSPPAVASARLERG